MPMQSQAQRRFLWAKHPTVARRFEDHTPKGVKLPEHVGDKKPADEKKAFAAAFILKCAAAGITDPAAVAAVARAACAVVKRANITDTVGNAAGHVAGKAVFAPVLGSVIAPAGLGFGLGALAGGAKNQVDTDDAETLRIAAQANAYRRRAAVAAAHAQVRKLLANEPSKYVVLGS